MKQLVEPTFILGLNGFRKAEDLMSTAVKARRHCESLLKDCIEQNHSSVKLLQSMDDISNNLCSIMDLSNCIRSVHPNAHFKKTASKVAEYLQPVLWSMNTNVELYRKLKSVDEGEFGMDRELREMFKSFIKDFELTGIDKGKTDLISTLNERVVYLSRVLESSSDYNLLPLHNLLKARHQIAEINRFESFAAMTLTGRHYSSVDSIVTLLEQVKGRSHLYNNGTELPSYTLDQLLRGFARLAEEEFGIKVSVKSCHFNWGLGVKKLDLGNHGSVFLDLNSRRKKPERAMHFTLRARKSFQSENIVFPPTDDLVQSAITLVSASLDTTSPIPFYDAQMIFHELGHCLHAVLSETKYQTLSGTRCSMEVAEFPSMFMELAFESPDFQYKYLGTHLNEDCIARLDSTKQQHLLDSSRIALIDLYLHNTKPPQGEDPQWIIKVIRQLGIEKEDIQHLNYLGNYGATFYTYPVCQMLAENVLRDEPSPWVKLKNLLKMGGLLDVSQIKSPGQLYQLVHEHERRGASSRVARKGELG